MGSFTLCLRLLSLCWLAVSDEVVQPNTASGHDNCSSTVLGFVEAFEKVSSLQGVATKLLNKTQDQCKSNKCPQVNLGSSCQHQSIDDIRCNMKDIYSTRIDVGTDDVCTPGCDDWPCKAACQGIDVGICYGADWLLCKFGCLGISSCVHKCEHAIVDPCKKKLIDECSDKCEHAFHQCYDKCEEALTLKVSLDFERLDRVVTSMSVPSLNAICIGDGLYSPLKFQATAAIRISDADLSLTVHASDVGTSTTNAVDLHNIDFTLDVPLSGELDCISHPQRVSMNIGQLTVPSFKFDVNVQLDHIIQTLTEIACASLTVCTDAIKGKISKLIKDEISKEFAEVPKVLQPAIQHLFSNLKCPHMAKANVSARNADVLLLV